ncbi:MAG: hypothetical protein JO313_05430 [Verrucomicrobia bacterium]|nr:hypothetical protein [Verrucomicrobiota bacterium]MBV9643779.1 hypothetical protein [Verrucomicrobiota bacterium]
MNLLKRIKPQLRFPLKQWALTPICQGMRSLAFVLSFLILPLASYAADDLDQLLQNYSVNTKTLAGLTATLVADIQASANGDQAATRIESYAAVYHVVAQAFQDLMPVFLKASSAGTVSTLERQSMIESSQRMSEIGKILTSASDAFDDALKPFQGDPRVATAVTTFSNEGHALQAIAQRYR